MGKEEGYWTGAKIEKVKQIAQGSLGFAAITNIPNLRCQYRQTSFYLASFDCAAQM